MAPRSGRLRLPKDRWEPVKLSVLKTSGATYFKKLDFDQFYLQTKFSDGDVYYQVRKYEDERLLTAVDEWVRRLTPCKQTSIRQLLKRRDMRHELDLIVVMPGQRKSLQLGNTQKIFAMGCDEVRFDGTSSGHTELKLVQEILNYLNHINKTWEKITLGLQEVKEAVDSKTADTLELLAPGRFAADRKVVIREMKCGELFPSITDNQVRRRIEQAILGISCMIPTLATLHKNAHYLELGAKAIKTLLLGTTCRATVQGALYKSWRYNHEVAIESEAATYTQFKDVAKPAMWNIVYKAIWISVLRDFWELLGRVPRKECKEYADREPTVVITPDPCVRRKFVQYAQELGIKTYETDALQQTDPRGEMLRLAIGQLYHAKDVDKIADDLVRNLPEAERMPNSECDRDYPDYSNEDMKRRCGVPYEHAYKKGKTEFFLENILDPSKRYNHEISVLFIFSDFISAFFGEEMDEIADDLYFTARDEGDKQKTQNNSRQYDGMDDNGWKDNGHEYSDDDSDDESLDPYESYMRQLRYKNQNTTNAANNPPKNLDLSTSFTHPQTNLTEQGTNDLQHNTDTKDGTSDPYEDFMRRLRKYNQSISSAVGFNQTNLALTVEASQQVRAIDSQIIQDTLMKEASEETASSLAQETQMQDPLPDNEFKQHDNALQTPSEPLGDILLPEERPRSFRDANPIISSQSPSIQSEADDNKETLISEENTSVNNESRSLTGGSSETIETPLNSPSLENAPQRLTQQSMDVSLPNERRRSDVQLNDVQVLSEILPLVPDIPPISENGPEEDPYLPVLKPLEGNPLINTQTSNLQLDSREQPLEDTAEIAANGSNNEVVPRDTETQRSTQGSIEIALPPDSHRSAIIWDPVDVSLRSSTRMADSVQVLERTPETPTPQSQTRESFEISLPSENRRSSIPWNLGARSPYISASMSSEFSNIRNVSEDLVSRPSTQGTGQILLPEDNRRSGIDLSGVQNEEENQVKDFKDLVDRHKDEGTDIRMIDTGKDSITTTSAAVLDKDFDTVRGLTSDSTTDGVPRGQLTLSPSQIEHSGEASHSLESQVPNEGSFPHNDSLSGTAQPIQAPLFAALPQMVEQEMDSDDSPTGPTFKIFEFNGMNIRHRNLSSEELGRHLRDERRAGWVVMAQRTPSSQFQTLLNTASSISRYVSRNPGSRICLVKPRCLNKWRLYGRDYLDRYSTQPSRPNPKKGRSPGTTSKLTGLRSLESDVSLATDEARIKRPNSVPNLIDQSFSQSMSTAESGEHQSVSLNGQNGAESKATEISPPANQPISEGEVTVGSVSQAPTENSNIAVADRAGTEIQFGDIYLQIEKDLDILGCEQTLQNLWNTNSSSYGLVYNAMDSRYIIDFTDMTEILPKEASRYTAFLIMEDKPIKIPFANFKKALLDGFIVWIILDEKTSDFLKLREASLDKFKAKEKTYNSNSIVPNIILLDSGTRTSDSYLFDDSDTDSDDESTPDENQTQHTVPQVTVIDQEPLDKKEIPSVRPAKRQFEEDRGFLRRPRRDNAAPKRARHKGEIFSKRQVQAVTDKLKEITKERDER
ncbi:hypothetical protein F5884DRAFT_899530 [Xylogone sp. PMI_703]|nr:hypothetical protein F5884DRAFT_899530 [Xylogone sp. PMI_703]